MKIWFILGHSKVHCYIFGVYMLQFFYRCLLLQDDNLNLATNLKKYCFCAMLIACKCTPLYKKLDYDAKNEPPYLVTTLKLINSLQHLNYYVVG